MWRRGSGFLKKCQTPDLTLCKNLRGDVPPCGLNGRSEQVPPLPESGHHVGFHQVVPPLASPGLIHRLDLTPGELLHVFV
jgi:hypothetical protein